MSKHSRKKDRPESTPVIGLRPDMPPCKEALCSRDGHIVTVSTFICLEHRAASVDTGMLGCIVEVTYDPRCRTVISSRCRRMVELEETRESLLDGLEWWESENQRDDFDEELPWETVR